MWSDRRAISDSLGFVLVFAIIVSTVATVYIGGFNSLDTAREFERMNNAERAFEVLAHNVEDITQRNAPSRATEIKLAEASIESGEPVLMEVRVERAGNEDMNTSRTYGSNPIVYRSEANSGNALYYSHGAVLRQSGENAVVAREPAMVLGDDRMIVPIIQTRGEGVEAVSGSSTELVRTEHSTTQVIVANQTTTSDVTINMTTERAGAWRSFFESEGADDCPDSVNTDSFVSCEWTNVDRVYVIRIAIDFTFA